LAAIFGSLVGALGSSINTWITQSHQDRRDLLGQATLSATDTIVLADVKNETSDLVFDDALDTALRYEMEQTPYLNVLGIDKLLGTLTQLKLPPTTRVTPEVARQVCLRTNSKMVISQSIGDAGNDYHLQMRALDCGTGATLAKEQANIGERNEVVHEVLRDFLGFVEARRCRHSHLPASQSRVRQISKGLSRQKLEQFDRLLWRPFSGTFRI
jgi:hypothetical protein